MKFNQFLFKSVLLLGASALLITGCKPDDDGPDLPPVDGNPEISILEPTNGLILAEAGSTVSMSYQMFDNELIASFHATQEVISSSGGSIMTETDLAGTVVTLATTQYNGTVSYTIPSFYPPYTVIKVRGYVTDNKGKMASALFNINVIPGPSAGSTDSIQVYDTEVMLYQGNAGLAHNYSLIGHKNGDDATLPVVERDLHEVSAAGGSFLRQVESPNNFGADSVIVNTDVSRFDYDGLTYQSMQEAFITSNRIGKVSEPLDVGDVILLKLSISAQPHYAAIKITSVGSDNIGFVYKYSYD
jgi:hypothetical protein